MTEKFRQALRPAAPAAGGESTGHRRAFGLWTGPLWTAGSQPVPGTARTRYLPGGNPAARNSPPAPLGTKCGAVCSSPGNDLPDPAGARIYGLLLNRRAQEGTGGRIAARADSGTVTAQATGTATAGRSCRTPPRQCRQLPTSMNLARVGSYSWASTFSLSALTLPYRN